MGLYYSVNLDDNDHTRTVFRCKGCACHLFTSYNVVSTNFRGKHGQGYLVDRVVNIRNGTAEQRSMMTGDYMVRDTVCQQCDTYVGWRYISSSSKNEKYKEGKFVMEVPQLKYVLSDEDLINEKIDGHFH